MMISHNGKTQQIHAQHQGTLCRLARTQQPRSMADSSSFLVIGWAACMACILSGRARMLAASSSVRGQVGLGLVAHNAL